MNKLAAAIAGVLASIAIFAVPYTASQFYAHHWAELANAKRLAQPDAYMCAFGDAACATAVATYLLYEVGVLAFVAGSLAAYWAGQAYRNETAIRLGHEICWRTNCVETEDLSFALLENLELAAYRPLNATKDFVAKHQRFINLGRTAIGHVVVRMKLLEKSSNDSLSYDIKIGMFGVADNQREKHIVVYIPRYFESRGNRVYVIMEWAQVGQKRIQFEAEPLARRATYVPTAYRA